MTSALYEFLILARVAGFGVVAYGVWLEISSIIGPYIAIICNPDRSSDSMIGDL